MIYFIKKKLNANQHLKEILTGSAIAFIIQILGMLLGYLVIVIISTKYGASGIGLFSLTISITTFIAMVASLGINMSVLRYAGQFNNTENRYKLKLLYLYAIKLVFPFSILLATTLFIFSDAIANQIFGNSEYTTVLQFSAFIIPFMTIQNIGIEYIRGLKNIKVSEYLRSLNRQIIYIILLLTLGSFIVDTNFLLYIIGIGVISTSIFSVYYIIKKINRIEIIKLPNFSKKELLSTSFPMMIIGIASFLMGDLSTILLGVYTTVEEVGIFTTMVKISLLVGLTLTIVNTIAAPKFSELYWAHKYDELQNILLFTSKINIFLSLIPAIMIFMFSDYILSFFGNEFLLGKNVLYLLIFNQLINALTGSAGVVLNMTGLQVIARNILLLASFITILLNFILIPIYGLSGAAISILIGSITLRTLNVYFVKKKLGFITLPFFFTRDSL